MFFKRSRNKWPEIPFEEIRKRSRILVIDDQDFPYQSLFQRDGYTLDKWDDIEKLSDLEDGNFDIILLDLQGVGRAESIDQGFGILRHLRDRSPSQIIVAYSNADWGLKYQDFFKLADAVLPKSADYVDFKGQIDDLLKQRFSLGFYISRILAEAQSLEIDHNKLETLASRSILRQKPEIFREFLEKAGVSEGLVDRLVSIINAAIGIYNLWNV